jgi:beta-1,4-mannooligosaccharide/beta-1,4-mannosyl-N-acetylglucosamine phosphorylase
VPLIAPEEIYETTGFVGGVVLPVATVNDSATARIAIYCGCADTVVGVAYTQVDELIAYIKANR